MLVSLPSLSNIAGNNMARQIRKKSGTGIYHVMLRGINRQDIFEDDEDYLQMTSILRAQSERYDEKGVRLSPFCKAFLQMSLGIANPLVVQSLEKTRRNEVLRYALSFGAGVRQLSRLTGVSFGVVQKLTK